jgi:hypothetical protein
LRNIYIYITNHYLPVDMDPDSDPNTDTDSDPDTGMRLIIERNTVEEGATDAINRLIICEVTVTMFLTVSESENGGLQPGLRGWG